MHGDTSMFLCYFTIVRPCFSCIGLVIVLGLRLGFEPPRNRQSLSKPYISVEHECACVCVVKMKPSARELPEFYILNS